MTMTIEACDALLLVDVQDDFMPGGALAVTDGDQIVAPLNALIQAFAARDLPIVATRDWHPPDHCSFKAQGGIWPTHCVATTSGARFHPALLLPAQAHIVSKATRPDWDSYSGFDGTRLAQRLQEQGVKRLLVGGLATDYCVLHTVLDGLAAGFDIVVLTDGIRAVNVKPGDGAQALERMGAAGAQLKDSSDFL
jgi:nicotinamidase/pyrazinamidase